MENPIAKTLRSIGTFEMIAGVVVGFILGNQDDIYNSPPNWSIVILWSAIGFISGMSFIGFAEIIDLLQSIKAKIYGTENNTNRITDNIEGEIKSENL